MHQRVVTYNDFNGVEHTDTLEFYISETRMFENYDIAEELADLQKNVFMDKERELTPSEVRRLVLLVKRVSRIGYGVRSADGTRFSQKEEIWEAFEESAAYNKFMLDLFTINPTEALNFVNAIFPAIGDRPDLEAKAREMYPDLFEDDNSIGEVKDSVPTVVTDISNEPVTKDERPAWLRENRPPTDDEFKRATPQEQLLAFKMRSTS